MRYLKTALLVFFAILFFFLPGEGILLRKMQEEKKETAKEPIPYDFDPSLYISLGDVSSIRASFEDPTVCTEKEIDQAVFRILLEKATFTETNRPAARYYKVKIDFSIEKKGEVLSSYSQTDYELIIGIERENEVEFLLGENLMGAVVGEERRVDYTYSDSLSSPGLAGEEVTLCALVKGIYSYEIPPVSDATIGELSSGEFQTVKEFRESVRENILEEKELARTQAVWLALSDQVQIHSYPEMELSDYREIVQSYYESTAAEYGMDLLSFVENYLDMNMDEFLAFTKEYAQEKVRNDLIFMQLVKQLSVTLSEEEYQEGALSYYESEEEEFSSFEEFESLYTKERLKTQLLWDKALRLVVESAQPVE